MNTLQFDISNLQIDRTTHWSDLVGRFTERINPDRISAGFKPYSYARVGMMLSGLTYAVMEQLYIKCDKASSFGKTFNYLIKNHKDI